MNDLLDRVLAAHGGLDRWDRISGLTARLSLGGPFWASRGWPDACAEQTVVLDTRTERISYQPFPGPGMVSEFTTAPEQIIIKDADANVAAERVDPRAGFPLPFNALDTRWDAVQVTYFASCAMWNYLTEPFVFTYPGVATEEIEPWDEAGDTWRRLAVTFPPSLPNHNRDQVFYYDSDFLLRRMDYSPDVTGHPPIAHYTHDYKTFESLAFPTRRLVHLRGPDGVANQDFAPITIDIHDVTVATPT